MTVSISVSVYVYKFWIIVKESPDIFFASLLLLSDTVCTVHI